MEAWKNPFDVLGASPEDSRPKLASLVEDAALMGGSQDAQDAHATLLNPEERLKAEIRWAKGESALAAFNRAFQSFLQPLFLDYDRWPLTGETARLCADFGRVNAAETAETINCMRMKAGFLSVAENDVHTALSVYAGELAKELLERLERWEKNGEHGGLAVFMCDLVRRSSAEKTHNSPLLSEMAAAYELKTAVEAAGEREEITRLVTLICDPKARCNPQKTTQLLCESLRRWHRIIQPMQVLSGLRGIAYAPGEACCLEVRKAMVRLTNEMELGNLGYQIAQTCRTCFGEIGSLKETLEEDYGVLREGHEKAVQRDEKVRRELKKNAIQFVIILVIVLIMNRCSY